MNVTKENLLGILESSFGKSVMEMKNVYTIPLTSPAFGLTSVELYQYIMCIEKTYNFLFDVDDFTNYDFSSISSICDTVSTKLTDKREA